jgi:hypothetical protein
VPRTKRWTLAFLAIVGSAVAALGAELSAQAVANNPYRPVDGWAKLPQGRVWGAVSGIIPDPDGQHLWVLERCGGNAGVFTGGCVGSDDDPILKFDLNGNLVKSLGKRLFAFPHGFFMDREGNLWVTEGAPKGDPRGEAGAKVGMGHQVFKLNQEGKVLMTLGTAGVAGDGPNQFNGPTGVVVAPNGDIWVTDGHGGGNNRLVRLSSTGRFIQAWGGGVDAASGDRGKFSDPHHIAIDSRGRIYVADRGNARIQIFDGEGKFLAQWTQFGYPDGIYIDANDVIYVADAHSGGERNPGWERGIRIGDAKTGWVTAFIPDKAVLPTATGTGAEFVAADAKGNVYSGQITPPGVVKWVRIRP